jgi:hypothetical protein
MSKYSAFSGQASLALMMHEMERMGVWNCIAEHVHISQKTVQHTPLQKLQGCFLNIVAGGQGVVEINTRVRSDGVLRQLLGGKCAEQSTISRTLNCCGKEQVEGLRTALKQLYQQHSQGYRHDYQRSWQLLDLDFTGVLAGRQAEGATKGYFAGHPHCRGRQIGRVLATRYHELVVERLYEGKQQLRQNICGLIQAATEVLDLDAERRARTILRADSGGGQAADLNWMLAQGYGVLVKMYSGQRAEKLARSVLHWISDPRPPHRSLGWPTQPFSYVLPTRQAIVRVTKVDGTFAYGALVTNVPPEAWFDLSGISPRLPNAELLALVYAYDRRGGGVETQNKADKQGLGLAKRNKHSFAAQEMLVLLAELAHNLLLWLARPLVCRWSQAAHFGILRLRRDLCGISGRLSWNEWGGFRSLSLNRAHPWAELVYRTFAPTWAADGLSLNLRKI